MTDPRRRLALLASSLQHPSVRALCRAKGIARSHLYRVVACPTDAGLAWLAARVGLQASELRALLVDDAAAGGRP